MENTEYVSIQILKEKYAEWKRYILSRKIAFCAVWGMVLAISVACSFIIPKKYTASLSFALQTSEGGGGGLLDLASQFGFSLGAGSMGAFGGDNLFELLSSRSMIERTLLQEQEVEGEKTNLLNLYIAAYELKEDWKDSKKPGLAGLSFPLSQARDTYARVQDSVLQVITHTIQKKQLSVGKRSKKLSIGDMSFISVNEQLSKLFVETLMDVTGTYYIQAKTKRQTENFRTLQHEVDSIRGLYSVAVRKRASAMDNSPNSIRSSGTTDVVEHTTEMQYLALAYTEMQKNLELARVSMNQNAPLIDVIDAPIYPLQVTRYGKLKAGVVGLFGGAFIALFVFSLLFVLRTGKP